MRRLLCLLGVVMVVGLFSVAVVPAAQAGTAKGRDPISATFTAPGPFATTTATITKGKFKYDVFRPAHYSKLKFKSPIVTWGDGTWAHPSMYKTLLSHFASYGITVIAVDLTNTGSGREIDAAAHYLVKADNTPGSVFDGHLNIHEVAAVGHSQGATGAVRVATMDPHLITSVMTFSLPETKWSFANTDCAVKADCEAHPNQLRQPVFFLSTHGLIDSVLASPISEEANFKSVRGRAALGIITDSGGKPADHSSLQDVAVGGNPEGELGYATAWLEYTLRDNKVAAAAFSGHHPELGVNTNWPDSRVKS